MRVVMVDRRGARAIWSVMTPVTRKLLERGDSVLWCRTHDNHREPLVPPPGTETWDIEVPSGRGPVGFLRRQRAFANAFREVLCEMQPDLVHTNFVDPGATARWLAGRWGVPAVVTTQHELYGSMYGYLRAAIKSTQRSADAVVYVSNEVAHSFPTRRSRQPGRPSHHVVYNAVDTQALASVRERVSEEKREARTQDAAFREIICPGRLVPVKGQRAVVEAFARVAGDHPRLRLVLAGSGPDADLLAGLAARRGVAEQVEIPGWVASEELHQRMARAAAVVLASDGSQEGFGLSLAEAICLGPPIICTQIGAFREVASLASADIHWFPPNDVERLVEQLRAAICLPAAESHNNRSAHPPPALDIRRMAQDYLDIYCQLIMCKPPRQTKAG